ncbi:MAG: hypothetical protein ABS39_09865 [Acidovorax sp. SCN 65-28]|jgi:FkbM family methyltransferase|uniref:FkbM family methyltransferase n=1 Tax=Acidovorax sp. TaxID=1872122 RepID=UPI00086BDE5F|nr:FkbM family methyltransferase [Acidovorax sp.]MBN9626601.1 FkbM family methyltransferase [Acidovorax sp.]ODS77453.1 MAG: hypothetical protein ABS39_09865 [Acidovorax sp. SCN 65-28]
MPSEHDAQRDWEAFLLDCQKRAQAIPRALVSCRPILVFGVGSFGRDLCTALRACGLEVQGFVESQPRQASALGLPVLSWDQARETLATAQLVIGVFNRDAPLNHLHALASDAGFQDIFMPWDVYDLVREKMGWRYWLEASSFLAEHASLLEKTYWALADAPSRQCLLDLCRFRMGLLPDYAAFVHSDAQYFNSITLKALPTEPAVYVDGGAYNGDTLIEFSKQHAVEVAYLFEPGQQNFAQLRHQCRDVNFPAVCLPLALSSGYEMLGFHDGNGEAGVIGQAGGSTIASVALDDVVHGKRLDFLKLDVEGAEVAALEGASALIARDRPVLALSLYHHPHDLWEIPAKVLSLCADYRLFLRQHHANSFDAVLYAVV